MHKKTDECRVEAVRHLFRDISRASLYFNKYKVEQRI